MLVSRRTFFFGSLALPALAAKKKPQALRPGILLILADELPAFMLGSYGNAQVHTPNLDLLAQMGIRFTNHFACTPAPAAGRSTLLTGSTPMQLGTGDVALATILGPAGYQTAEGDAAAAAQFLDGQSAGKPFFFTLNCPTLRPPYDKVSPKSEQLYAIEPFQGYAPDLPAANAADGKEMLRTILGNVRKAAGTLTDLDAGLKPVLDKIRTRGLSDSTMIIFTAACGGLWGRHGLWDSGAASDPPNMFEEAVRTPIFWSWPGHIPAVAHRPELVSAYDFVPTICDMLTLEAPKRNLCGRSYAPLVQVKELPKNAPWRKSVCAQLGNTGMAREDRYKLVARNGGKGPNELYDLVVDPTEKENQAENAQFVTLRNELQGILDQWTKRSSSTEAPPPETTQKGKKTKPKAGKSK